jgi:type I phosphodiesterase/nucleotide pyrophosphatase
MAAATFDVGPETYVRPDFDGAGLANVAPTVLRLLVPHADGLDLPSLSDASLPARLLNGVRTVVLIVADGLGHLQLQREMSAGNAPNMQRMLSQDNVNYAVLTSVFPTTTVAALGSINSAVLPTEHGLLGYTLYLPDFDMVGEMIRWGPLNRRISFSDPEFGRTPEEFFWAQTTYQRLHAAGLERTFAVNPNHFSGTALTRMLHQGATYQGYVATSSLDPLVTRLVNESREPTYIYAYWPTVDTIAHVVGPLTEEHSAEVATLDAALGRLVQHLPRRGDTLLVLTADHGHIDTQPERSVALGEHPELLAMLRVPPAGEARAVYLHPKPGAAGEVEAYARERLSDVATPLAREDAVRLGLFGPRPLSEQAAARIGEVLLFARGNLQLHAPLETPEGVPIKRPAFRGLHGGLTAEEALVPLLAMRL